MNSRKFDDRGRKRLRSSIANICKLHICNIVDINIHCFNYKLRMADFLHVRRRVTHFGVNIPFVALFFGFCLLFAIAMNIITKACALNNILYYSYN